jgi:hypothetical protein
MNTEELLIKIEELKESAAKRGDDGPLFLNIEREDKQLLINSVQRDYAKTDFKIGASDTIPVDKIPNILGKINGVYLIEWPVGRDMKTLSDLFLTDPESKEKTGILSVSDNKDGTYSILTKRIGSNVFWRHTIKTEEY